MKRHLYVNKKIDCCKNCYYFNATTWDFPASCKHPKAKATECITQPKRIPKWCPLPKPKKIAEKGIVLKDIPIEDIKVGTTVRSKHNGNVGKINEIIFDTKDEDNSIVIVWMDGGVSIVWHFQAMEIEIIEKEFDHVDRLDKILARKE